MILRKPHLPIMILVLLSLLGCAAAGPAGDPSPRSASAELASMLEMRGYRRLPLEPLRAGLFVVRAWADTVPLVLVLDTGAGRTTLDRGRAEALGLALAVHGTTAAGLGASGQQVRVGTLRRVRIGSVALDSLAVAVLDLSHVNQGLRAAGDPPIHGVLGADFLRGRGAVIDYAAPALYVRAPAGPP